MYHVTFVYWFLCHWLLVILGGTRWFDVFIKTQCIAVRTGVNRHYLSSQTCYCCHRNCIKDTLVTNSNFPDRHLRTANDEGGEGIENTEHKLTFTLLLPIYNLPLTVEDYLLWSGRRYTVNYTLSPSPSTKTKTKSLLGVNCLRRRATTGSPSNYDQPRCWLLQLIWLSILYILNEVEFLKSNLMHVLLIVMLAGLVAEPTRHWTKNIYSILWTKEKRITWR